MSYNGTTSATPNPPIEIAGALGGPLAANSTSVAAGRRLWYYNSSDASTAWQNAGYFTDGANLGFRNGDGLMGISWSTESSTGHVFVLGALVTTNSTAGWNLSTGGSMTSTFN